MAEQVEELPVPKDAVSITTTLTVNGVECTGRLSSEGLSWGDGVLACQGRGGAEGKNITRGSA